MSERPLVPTTINHQIARMFALVSEALAGATLALLGGDTLTGRAIVDGDLLIDDLTVEIDRLVWAEIESGNAAVEELRRLVAVLLIVPELERSADLAEHIAQRAIMHLGSEMSPKSRGLVQRMSDIALGMWRTVADAYTDQTSQGVELDEADEQIDELRDRLTEEVASGTMGTAVAAQVTLLARFYERLGDHAVNLARRIDRLQEP